MKKYSSPSKKLLVKNYVIKFQQSGIIQTCTVINFFLNKQRTLQGCWPKKGKEKTSFDESNLKTKNESIEKMCQVETYSQIVKNWREKIQFEMDLLQVVSSLFLVSTLTQGLKINSVVVPKYAKVSITKSIMGMLPIDCDFHLKVDESTSLIWGYDISADQLDSVKWYKDNMEFYRYVPP